MTGTDDRAADEIGPDPDPNAAPHALLTIADVAQLLQVNIKTVRRMIDRGEMAHIRIGRQYRVERGAFEAFIAARRYRPVLISNTEHREDIL